MRELLWRRAFIQPTLHRIGVLAQLGLACFVAGPKWVEMAQLCHDPHCAAQMARRVGECAQRVAHSPCRVPLGDCVAGCGQRRRAQPKGGRAGHRGILDQFRGIFIPVL
jgi:hypothetical protein